jgi:transposase
MRSRVIPNPEIVEVKRLDHLPLVGVMLRELAVKDTRDALIPRHDRHAVTVGECVEALVLTRLTGEPALSQVADTLASDDLEVIFPRLLDASHFHDNRLGRVLDALWSTGLDRVYGAVISQAIRHYALELTRLPTDTTSLKVYGAYERDEGEEGPRVTVGYSRDHRPDLKPWLFGLTVTADGVPVWGQMTDGNGPADRRPAAEVGGRPGARRTAPAVGTTRPPQRADRALSRGLSVAPLSLEAPSR